MLDDKDYQEALKEKLRKKITWNEWFLRKDLKKKL